MSQHWIVQTLCTAVSEMLDNSSVIAIAAFVIGAAVGSFINAAEYRLFRGIGLLKEKGAPARSRCTHCQAVLKPLDLIPIISFLVLRGRCRSCHKPVSWQYPMVEVAAGVIALILYLQFGLALESLVVACFGWLLLFFFVYDLKYQLVPDQIILPAIVIVLLCSLWRGHSLTSLLLGALIAGGFFAAQYVLSRGRWIGAGDIRLGVLLGMMLGWQLTIVALFFAYVSGAIVALVLLIRRTAQLHTKIPFGTFLAVAGFISLLYGQYIINWYLALL